MNASGWNSKLRRKCGALALFAILSAGLWFWLGQLNREVSWLKVETAPGAVIGQPFRVRVHVVHPPAPTMICADLHWTQERHNPKGFLASGPAHAVGPAGGQFDFEITVPPQAGPHYVNVVIYLSPDGNWGNHTFAANTRLIPVSTNSSAGASRLVPRPVYEFVTDDAHPQTALSPWPRRLTGFVWLLTAGFLGRPALRTLHWRRALILGVLLVGIAELAGLEAWLGHLTRDFARAHDLYYPREFFQRTIISFIAATAATCLWSSWRKNPRRLLKIGLGFYLAIAVVNLLSLHALDQYAASSWLGFTLVDALKLVCALTALIGVARTKDQHQLPP